MVVRFPSNLRDNWSRNEQNETFGVPWSGMYVSNLGPNIPHKRSKCSKHQWSSNLLRVCTIVWGRRWDSFSRRRGSTKRSALFASSLCHEPDIRTTGQPDGRPLFSFWPSKTSREARVLLEEFATAACVVQLHTVIVKHSRSVRVLVL